MTPAREQADQNQSAQAGKYADLLKNKSLVFIHETFDGRSPITVTVPPDTFQRPGMIKPFLIQHTPSESPIRAAIEADRSFTSNINKVLRGLVPHEPGQEARPRYKGWLIRVSEDAQLPFPRRGRRNGKAPKSPE